MALFDQLPRRSLVRVELVDPAGAKRFAEAGIHRRRQRNQDGGTGGKLSQRGDARPGRRRCQEIVEDLTEHRAPLYHATCIVVTTMRLPQWVPPIAWMVVILALSTDSGSSENTGRFLFPALRFVLPTASPLVMETIHGFIRKLAHVTEYAALAGLWYRAFAGRWPSPLTAVIALGLSVAWAGVDEAFQGLPPSRPPSLVDVGVDAVGALLASVGAIAWPRVVDVVTSTLLWTAMIVGCAALVINGLGGIASGTLWVTASAAVLAVAVRARTSSG